MKPISFTKVVSFVEQMKPGEGIEFTAKSVGGQYTEVLVSVSAKGISGTYPLQDDRQTPEELFREHIIEFSRFGVLEIEGLHAVLKKR